MEEDRVEAESRSTRRARAAAALESRTRTCPRSPRSTYIYIVEVHDADSNQVFILVNYPIIEK